MSNNWVPVYSTKMAYLGEIVKGLFEEEDIPCVSIDKTDSMHVQLFEGEIEVFVKPNDVIRAKRLLEKNEL